MRYHSEAGLEHHKSDYMKRLLKKVEENFEKSKIRNRKLLARAEQALNDANMAQSTHLVSSKVKLEVAKVGFRIHAPIVGSCTTIDQIMIN